MSTTLGGLLTSYSQWKLVRAQRLENHSTLHLEMYQEALQLRQKVGFLAGIHGLTVNLQDNGNKLLSQGFSLPDLDGNQHRISAFKISIDHPGYKPLHFKIALYYPNSLENSDINIQYANKTKTRVGIGFNRNFEHTWVVNKEEYTHDQMAEYLLRQFAIQSGLSQAEIESSFTGE